MFEGIIMSDTNQPIAFANVIAEKINTNELITGTISDEFGKFSLEINSNTPFNISIT
ncbi:carboxypeptidase regulatory-like domain-containing protein [Aquimarina agarivorans]|uniref:carboxypeptidase regulatory-like domain-containing protein n=1 Tax=Aquimarina agarivorans TaxID=980584 RepID=UPI0002DB3107|nr:carboxypeptidase regulatory-like domain-containing protein [Aquimarina agarivorans]